MSNYTTRARVRTLAVVLVSLAALSAPTLAFARTLYLGATGSDVVALQNDLIATGDLAAGNATGYFGSKTLAAVRKFQCRKSIVCSGSSYGVAGPQTQAALNGGGITVAPAASGGGYSGKLEVGGWIPYWREATGTADVLPHLSQMTEASPFTYTVKSDGTLYDAGGMSSEPWTSFIAQAKSKRVRVIPTVMWGDGDTEQAVLSNSAKRIALEDAIAREVKTMGYDGIDIDFEAKHAETKNYFSTFLKGLYARMGNKWVYCSIEARMPLADRYGYNTTPPADATDYANDYTAINKYCDRVEIMTYDQGTIDTVLNNSRAAPYAPVADPAWVENVINLAAQTISKKKILIGVPTYGYEYSVTPDGSGGFDYKLLWAFNQLYATQLAAQLNITPVRDSAGELSYIYKSTPETQAAAKIAATPGSVEIADSTNNVSPPSATYSQQTIAGNIQPPFNYVSWSDARAIADKVALAQKLGVRGIAIFKLDGGEDQNLWTYLPGGTQYASR